MPPAAHALLGASSAHRWIACPPSARLSARMDELYGRPASHFAEEGTKAHALCELKVKRALQKEKRAAGLTAPQYKKQRAALGEIPEDMEHSTDSWCDLVMEKVDKDPNATVMLEVRVDYSKYVPEGFGTADCVIVGSNGHIDVMDYKHGLGVQVDAENNPQLRLYALGVLEVLMYIYDITNDDPITMTIVQPRLQHVSFETMTVKDLIVWASGVVEPAAKLAYEGKGEFVPGEHCRFCSVKPICAARAAESLKLFQTGLPAAATLDADAIADILPRAELAESWIKDLFAFAEAQALKGEHYRGYKVVRGKKPNRVWTDEASVRETLNNAGYTADQIEERSLKSVTVMEKMIGKKDFQGLVGGLVSQGEGKLKLVPESDKREAVDPMETGISELFDN